MKRAVAGTGTARRFFEEGNEAGGGAPPAGKDQAARR